MSSARRSAARHVVVLAILVPLAIMLAVAAFAWPSARLQPRNLPVGIVGTTATPLDRILGAGDAFDVHRYADQGAARAAIENRTVYGAFEAAPAQLTVLV